VQRSYTAKKLSDRMRAQILAEAGANDALKILKLDFNAWSGTNFPMRNSYGGGSNVVVARLANANAITLASTGMVTSGVGSKTTVTRSEVALTLTKIPMGGGGTGPDTSWATNEAFNYAWATMGDINMVGNMTMNMGKGKIRSKGKFYANGNQTIIGNIYSSSNIYIKNLTGTGMAPVVTGCSGGTVVVSNLPPLYVPIIDLTPYCVAASNNGCYSNGNVTLPSGYSPPGGILYVNGNLTFSPGTYSGCFIASSNISMSGGNASFIFTQNTNGYPVMATVNGGIELQGGAQSVFVFTGLIYVASASGSFNKSGNGEVNGVGTIMTRGGGISKNGGWSGMLYTNSTPVYPGTTSSTNYTVGVTVWQK
jgi:hypothetical protein